jgi:hypothetical protein
MKTLVWAGAAAVLLGSAGAARADVVIDVPFAHIRVGRPTVIRVPFVQITLPGGVCLRRAAAPRLAPAGPPPVPQGETLPVPNATPARAAAPVSVQEFARTFKPSPEGGAYEVVLKHTFTGKPVPVAFTLPAGAPRRIVAGKLRLEFRYGIGKSVVVRFYRDGSVKVVRG